MKNALLTAELIRNLKFAINQYQFRPLKNLGRIHSGKRIHPGETPLRRSAGDGEAEVEIFGRQLGVLDGGGLTVSIKPSYCIEIVIPNRCRKITFVPEKTRGPAPRTRRAIACNWCIEHRRCEGGSKVRSPAHDNNYSVINNNRWSAQRIRQLRR